MIGPSSILSIIDFSESSKEVLQWAVGMAEKLNVHLTILHPYRLNQVDKKEDMVGVKKKLELDASKNFEHLAHGLLKNQKVSFDFRAEVGFIQDRIEDYARRNNILFLVIGGNLANGNKEILEEIIEESEAPLVVVPSAVKKNAKAPVFKN
jgi:nucleotide-binding universal stress UspA family protein